MQAVSLQTSEVMLVSLLEEARALSRHQGSACSLSTVEPKLLSEINEAIAAGVDKSAIAAALKARKIDIGASALRRHARGDCKCRS